VDYPGIYHQVLSTLYLPNLISACQGQDTHLNLESGHCLLPTDYQEELSQCSQALPTFSRWAQEEGHVSHLLPLLRKFVKMSRSSCW